MHKRIVFAVEIRPGATVAVHSQALAGGRGRLVGKHAAHGSGPWRVALTHPRRRTDAVQTAVQVGRARQGGACKQHGEKLASHHITELKPLHGVCVWRIFGFCDMSEKKSVIECPTIHSSGESGTTSELGP